jgi:guanylate kinase
LQELESRLKNRNTETEEQIKTRLERISYELDKKDLYDYVVVNDKLEKAVEDVENIIKLEKNKEK